LLLRLRADSHNSSILSSHIMGDKGSKEVQETKSNERMSSSLSSEPSSSDEEGEWKE
jgi:hypothetical protein